MSLFGALFLSLAHLIGLALDIVGFFLIVRIVSHRWRIRSLLAMDRVGQPLVDPLVDATDRLVPGDWIGQGRRRHFVTAFVLLTVALCRLILDALVT